MFYIFLIEDKSGSKPNIFNENEQTRKLTGEKNERKNTSGSIKPLINDSFKATKLIKALSPVKNKEEKQKNKSDLKKYVNKLGTIESTQNINKFKSLYFENNDLNSTIRTKEKLSAPFEKITEEAQLKKKFESLKSDLNVAKSEKSKSKIVPIIKNVNNIQNEVGLEIEQDANKTKKLQNEKIPDNLFGKEFNHEKNSEKKNIFYTSFKSIQDRFSFKEQRINKIQICYEKIQKQLRLPLIKKNK